MLVRRALARLQQVNLHPPTRQRRPTFPSHWQTNGNASYSQTRSYLMPVERRTITDKVFYKKDGTPRSKWKGFGLISVALVLYMLYEAVAAIDELDNDVKYLVALVNIQRVDHNSYNSVDLSDFGQTLQLFRQFLTCVGLASKEIIDDVYQHLEEHSGDSRLHSILRKACEDVHTTIQKNEDGNALLVAAEVAQLLDKSVLELLTLMNVRLKEAIKEYNRRTTKNSTSVDTPKPEGEDYEVVG